MPDPRRLYRRITESTLPTRVIAHLSVVGLVLAASFVGFGGRGGTDGAGPTSDPGFIALISQARGAAGPTINQDPITFDTEALNEEQDALDRGAPAGIPGTPLPTPVPVDPDATPLPAPGSGVGGTAGSSGLSTRGSAGAPAAGSLLWPVPAGSISQYYHAGHLALDIAAPYGSIVVAAAVVAPACPGHGTGVGGNVIAIDHGNGMQTVYNHLGSIWVGVGQYVGAGQGIGAVGCTGMCTGPHVHFEVIVNGVIDNPLRYL